MKLVFTSAVVVVRSLLLRVFFWHLLHPNFIITLHRRLVQNRFEIASNLHQFRSKLMVHICFEFERHLSPSWLPTSFWVLFGRLLVGALGRLRSILEAFWSDFHAKMEPRWHLNLISPRSYGKTARKLKTFEPKLAPKFLLGASRAALGRCLGQTWEHFGSVLARFSR